MIMESTAIFDILAQNYDADFTASQIGRLQRKRVWSFLNPVLKEAGRPLRILEINCGTGEDALQLAASGHSVIATDASAVMIEKAQAKLNDPATASLDLQFIVSPFSELYHLLAHEKFDLIFSDFGGLNCIERTDLRQLAHDLSFLTNEGGHIFFVLMAPYCLWEIFYYGIRGKFKTAFRRLRRSSGFTINDTTMPVYYYRPGTIKKLFSPAFSHFQKQPIGLFIPPSYLEERFRYDTGNLERLNRREEKFSSPLFSAFADHYCAIFKRTATNA